ncbi:MAG TPA: DUF6650 family protein [Pirellulales bacterium]|nr:DUF6650 family protein [Pirellulales bacterium]
MKFKEIVARLTGITCPIFGVSWTPPEPEIAAARRVLTFLEDRRVLYEPSEVEIPPRCVDSVLQIRERLTTELLRVRQPSEFAASLRAMRAACRRFLSRVQDADREITQFGNHPGHFASWVFNDALGQLRGVFGIHIAQLAARHGLDVEDDLARIVPELPEGQ